MELPFVVEEGSQLFLHFFRHCFFIFDDGLHQFYQNLISLDNAIVLTIQVSFDILYFPNEVGTVFDVITLALLYDPA